MSSLRDTIRSDGSFDRPEIRAFARRKAEHDGEGFGPALKTIFAIVKQVWTAHPANADKVKMVTVHGYGPRRDGVRRSAF
jgi:hypothetical protein